MACHRCFGLCVDEYLLDNGHRLIALRCVNCGNIVDPMIIENRKKVREEGELGDPSKLHPAEPLGCGAEI